MLSTEKIEYIINSEIDPRINWAREMNKKLLLHVDGVGLDEYLSKINGYENDDQFDARKKHAISNKFIVEELLRPTDNAFNARGGSKNYKFTANSELNEITFAEKLSKIRNSHSLSWYIESEWFHKFITDPNGLIVIESDGDEIPQADRNAYPTYKSIQSIRAYEQNGIFVDWVVFEPHLIIEGKREGVSQKNEKEEYFWCVDEENWYLFVRKDGKIAIRDIIEHGFDRVPAVLCSDITENVTGWKKSPIDAQVELLDKYLVSNSVLSIVEFFHNYPQQFIYVDECQRCGGTGNISTKANAYEQCPNCDNGKMERKDVTDIIKLRVPKGDEQKIDPPSGYIYMPTEPWDLMTKAVDRVWNRIFFTHWGTVVSREGKNETATGRFIDAQPVNNRLNKYSKTIESIHSTIANFIGKFYFPETFDKAFIQYGRRYLIETPDQIWEKYLDAKTQKAPVTTLDILLMQYLESEYRENDQMFVVEQKKAKIEPFVHWDIALVRQSATISDFDKLKKELFGEWVGTLDIEYIYKTNIEILRKELEDFAKSKEIPKMNENEEDI